ncbi:PAS domain S-box protein [bacterium]|nr:PAS domain S-box protein [bacterium]
MTTDILLSITQQLHRIEERLSALEPNPVAPILLETTHSMIDHLADATSDLIIEGPLSGRVEFISPSIAQLGYSISTVLYSDGFSFVHPDDLPEIRTILSHLPETKTATIILRIAHSDGYYIPFECRINLIPSNGDQTEPRAIIVARDISERIRTLQELQQSVDEKDVLLKEIHHRVKNNLQIISSMLNIQGHYFGDPHVKAVFKECQNRIRSMALVHETLYQSKSLANIEFSTYIKNLVNRIAATYREISHTVDVTILVPEVSFHIDTAVACGLIVNELVTNAFKYAFEGRASGQLWVTLIEHDSKYLLTVRDNGIGLPRGIDIKKSNSMGLELVMTLSRQLDAEIEIDKINGTSFTLVFSERSL